MSFEEADLLKIAEEAKKQNANESGQPEGVVSEDDKEVLAQVQGNDFLMSALKDGVIEAEVTSETIFEGVRPGPPATAENRARLERGEPALFPDGTKWYPPGKEPVGEVALKDEPDTASPTKPTLPPRPEPLGLVIEHTEEEKPQADIPPESLESVNAYIDNMEKDYAEAEDLRKMAAQFNPSVASAEELRELHGEGAVEEMSTILAKASNNEDKKITLDDIAEEDENDRTATDERVEKFNEVIVSIDKVNSNNLQFTAEERAILQKVDKIKLEEVEVVDLAKIRRRKAKSGAIDTLISRKGNTANTFNMIIPASGYVATLSGCSLHELMNLIRDGSDPVQDYLLKWSIIHSKVVTTTIGDMPDFDYFMKHTADADINAFVYGIMVASLPSNDTIKLTCGEPKCKTPDGGGREYDFEYTVRSLLRIEEFSDDLIDTLAEIAKASTTLEAATEVHLNSRVMRSSAFRLPDSGQIFEVVTPSAYDFLERTLKVVTNNEEIKPEYSGASVTASRVNSVIIETEDGMVETTTPLDIIKLIYSLPPRDILILERKISQVNDGISFSFGFIDITCPYCKNHTEVLPMDISELLFIRNAKVMETIVE